MIGCKNENRPDQRKIETQGKDIDSKEAIEHDLKVKNEIIFDDSLNTINNILEMINTQLNHNVQVVFEKKTDCFNIKKSDFNDVSQCQGKPKNYKLGYDQNKVLSRVRCYSDNNLLYSIEYLPNLYANAKIAIVKIGDKGFINGFLILQNKGNVFYLAMSKLKAREIKLKNISNIMQLDSMLNCINDMKFYNQRLLYLGKIRYRNSEPVFEKVYVPNAEIIISDKLNLSELEDSIMRTSEWYEAIGEVPIEISEHKVDYPLWYWGGTHLFR